MKARFSIGLASVLLSSSMIACDSGGSGGGSGDGGGDGAVVEVDASTSEMSPPVGGMPAAGSGGSGASTETDAGAPDAAAPVEDAGVSPSTSAFAGERDTSIGTMGVLETPIEERWILGARASGDDVYLFTIVVNPPVGNSFEGLAVSRFDWEGMLDTSYGDDGTLYPRGMPEPRGGAQPDSGEGSGRACAVGGGMDLQYIKRIFIYRYDATGQPDASFGTAGQVDIAQTDLTGQTGMTLDPSAIYALPDDSLLLFGYFEGNGSHQWFVAKLHDDGSLDTDWGEAGYVLIPSDYMDAIGPMHVTADGTIFAAARRLDDTRTTVVVKISADGVLDMDYGTDGLALIATGQELKINALVADEKGRVVGVGAYPTSGSSSTAAYATRLTADGELDTSFGTAGEVKIDYITLASDSATYLDYFHDVWLDGDQITIAGFNESTVTGRPQWYVMARLNDDGSLDPSFPFTASALADVSFQLGVAGSAFPSVPVVLPTPDGTSAVGFGNYDGKIRFVRWN